MYQDDALFPHMTVLENVGFGPRMQHQSDDSNESLRLLGIEHLADRLPGCSSSTSPSRPSTRRPGRSVQR
nr:hypothetical protein [Methanosphaerula palustris]